MKKEEGQETPAVEREVKPVTSRLAETLGQHKKAVSLLMTAAGAALLLIANWFDPSLFPLFWKVAGPYAKPAIATWVSVPSPTPEGARMSRMIFLNTRLITASLASGEVNVPMAITVSHEGTVLYTVTGGFHSKDIFDDGDLVITGDYDFAVNYDFAVEKQFTKPFLLRQLGIHSPGKYSIQLTARDVYGNVISTTSFDFIIVP